MKLRHWKRVARGFAADRSGATAVEYGLVAALVAVVILGAMTSVGSEVNATYGTISTKVEAAVH